MQDCVRRGCTDEGILPGGLKIKRRAPLYFRKLQAGRGDRDPFEIMDWVNLYSPGLRLGHFPIIRVQPAPPPNHPKGTLASGGWAGERTGPDFT